MKIKLELLKSAVGKTNMSWRVFCGRFGGERRVLGWLRMDPPRNLAGVLHALRCRMSDLCTVEEPVIEPVEPVIEPVIQKPEPVDNRAYSESALKRMNNESLIVIAHDIDPDIDLPDDATKRVLVGIILDLQESK
jgi:hypothetical protein